MSRNRTIKGIYSEADLKQWGYATVERMIRARHGLLDIFRSTNSVKGVVTIRLKQNFLLAHCGPARKHRTVSF